MVPMATWPRCVSCMWPRGRGRVSNWRRRWRQTDDQADADKPGRERHWVSTAGESQGKPRIYQATQGPCQANFPGKRDSKQSRPMIDPQTTLGELKELVREFSRGRDGTVPRPEGPRGGPRAARSANCSNISGIAHEPIAAALADTGSIGRSPTSWPTASGWCCGWPTSAGWTSRRVGEKVEAGRVEVSRSRHVFRSPRQVHGVSRSSGAKRRRNRILRARMRSVVRRGWGWWIWSPRPVLKICPSPLTSRVPDESRCRPARQAEQRPPARHPRPEADRPAPPARLPRSPRGGPCWSRCSRSASTPPTARSTRPSTATPRPAATTWSSATRASARSSRSATRSPRSSPATTSPAPSAGPAARSST